MVLMKKLFILTVLLMAVATGCKKDKNPTDHKSLIVGEWHYTSEELEADVYASFEKNGDFDLYQKIGDGRHRHYDGRWTIEGNTISGTYSDGSAWGSAYQMEFSGEDTMTLTALNGSNEVITYTRESVPSDVKDSAVEVSTRMLNSQPQYRWL
jgi:uncharacterized protein (TIGR03066 family)